MLKVANKQGYKQADLILISDNRIKIKYGREMSRKFNKFVIKSIIITCTLGLATMDGRPQRGVPLQAHN